MGKFKDLTGQTFGKLTVIKRVEDQKERHFAVLPPVFIQEGDFAP